MRTWGYLIRIRNRKGKGWLERNRVGPMEISGNNTVYYFFLCAWGRWKWMWSTVCGQSSSFRNLLVFYILPRSPDSGRRRETRVLILSLIDHWSRDCAIFSPWWLHYYCERDVFCKFVGVGFGRVVMLILECCEFPTDIFLAFSGKFRGLAIEGVERDEIHGLYNGLLFSTNENFLIWLVHAIIIFLCG